MTRSVENDRNNLLEWYRKNRRPLPWRSHGDAYRIWISEVMLQQTTVAAVIPFYTRFIEHFPNVKKLATSSIEDVYHFWAGLGYYSRARNLHKAAQIINYDFKGKFPQTHTELIHLPGFGPYTSRAVASLAFNESVGVLDGNVIRILSRKYGIDSNWWLPKEREKLQVLSDQLADTSDNSDVNQAMMELGATVCTPKKPLCALCPWKKSCKSLKEDKIFERPRAKKKEIKEIWIWDFDVELNREQKISLSPNQETPFLKDMMLPKSQAKKLNAKPKDYDFKHSVTKYDIYVRVKKSTRPKSKANNTWVNISESARINPTSLLKKIIKQLDL